MALGEQLDGVDALGLAALVAAGEVTPEELLEQAIDRVDRLNPTVNAVVRRMDDEARRHLAEDLPEKDRFAASRSCSRTTRRPIRASRRPTAAGSSRTPWLPWTATSWCATSVPGS